MIIKTDTDPLEPSSWTLLVSAGGRTTMAPQPDDGPALPAVTLPGPWEAKP